MPEDLVAEHPVPLGLLPGAFDGCRIALAMSAGGGRGTSGWWRRAGVQRSIYLGGLTSHWALSSFI